MSQKIHVLIWAERRPDHDHQGAAHIAALGGKADVPTMDGLVTMTIPSGTSSGARLRLKGKGMPKRGSDEHADLFARVMIDVPKNSVKNKGRLTNN